MKLLTTHELADIMKVHPETIRRKVQDGMPCLGGKNEHRRFVLEKVLEWMEGRNNE